VTRSRGRSIPDEAASEGQVVLTGVDDGVGAAKLVGRVAGR
jgi:NOL1/NOP2/fmu family ribosome biogenesis protein